MSLDTRKTILGFGLGITVFILSLKTWLKTSGDSGMLAKSQKAVSSQDVQTAITAYAAAVSDGADTSVLNDMNRAFAAEMNLRVYQDSNTGEIVATDLSGNEIASSAPAVAAPVAPQY